MANLKIPGKTLSDYFNLQDFKDDLTALNTDIANAQSTASTASNTASNALTTANTAQSTANSAQSSATTANTTANSITTKVNNRKIFSVSDYTGANFSAQLQACINDAQAQGLPKAIVFIPSGDYYLDSAVTVKHGNSTDLVITGDGARIHANTTGMVMIDIVAGGTRASYGNLGQTVIRGLTLEGSGKAAKGIQATDCDGVFLSLIDRVDIRDCTECIVFNNSRFFIAQNCTLMNSANSGSCISFYGNNSLPTCDMWFSNINAGVHGSDTGAFCIKMIARTSGSIGGIHFSHCVFYSQAVYADADSTGAFNDLFFDNCANDGANMQGGYYGYQLQAASQNSGNVYMTNCWTNATGIGLYFKNLGAVDISGGKVSSTYYHAVNFDSCHDVSMRGVKMYDANQSANGGGIVNIANTTKRPNVSFNSIYNTNGRTSQSIVIGANVQHAIIIGNTTDGSGLINCLATGTNGTDFMIFNNL